MQVAKLYRIGVVIGAGLFAACSGTQEYAEQLPTTKAATGPLLDVPALLGTSFDSVARYLGPPLPLPPGYRDPLTLSLLQRGEPIDSAQRFQRHRLDIIVTYQWASRRVTDFMLLGADVDGLMRKTNLKPTATNYLTLPVYRIEEPAKLLGLRVVPK